MIEPSSFRFDRPLPGVALLTLERPARLNALTFDVYRELRDCFRALGDDAAVDAVVLTGEGRAFCSGGDVEEIIGALVKADPAAQEAFTRLTGETVLAMRELRKPIIAAVNGLAAGGGAALALAADLRLAAPEASIAFLFTRVGLSAADMGVTWLLPRIVGAGRAAELLYTGEPIDAARAHAIGLYNHVIPDGRLLDEALAVAGRIAAGPTRAHAVTKELLLRSAALDLPAALEAEAAAQAALMQSADFREGYEAFVARRPPRFSGR